MTNTDQSISESPHRPSTFAARPEYPYPGLRPFREDESDIFFGRFEQIAQLIEKLGQNNFLSVVGPSGCGKSSLIYAGLLPKLNTGLMLGGQSEWRFAKMRPGAQPLAALAEALVRSDGLTIDVEDEADRIDETGLLYGMLARGPLGMIEAFEETPLRPYTKLLLLVDQFEEVFRYSPNGVSDEAEALVSLLLETARHAKATRQAIPDDDAFPVYIVLTMRTDYLGHCNRFPGLPEAINKSQFLTPRMTRDQRRAAITGPAYQYDGRVSDELVNRLLNDMGDEPDQLPIMQHALMRMWTEASKRDGGESPVPLELTTEMYESSGGWRSTLSNHADEAFDELDEPGKLTAEKLFRCLTEPGPDGRGVRRPVSVDEVAAVAGVSPDEVKQVVQAFQRSHRDFLTARSAIQHDDKEMVDISHESLIRQWRRLRSWVQQENQSAEEYKRLEQTYLRKEQGKEDFLRPPALDVLLEWRDKEDPSDAWAKRYGKHFEESMQFLDASEKFHTEQVEKEENRRREELAREKARAEEKALSLRRLRRLTLALVVFVAASLAAAAIAVILAIQAEHAKEQAEKTEKEAVKSKNDAKRAEARNSVSLASENCERGEIPTGILRFLAAENAAPPNDPIRESARRVAAGWGRTLPYRVYHNKGVVAVAFNRNGNSFATASKDKTACIWDMTTKPLLGKPLVGHENELTSVVFNRGGTRILTGSYDKTARLWDVKTAKQIAEVQHEDTVFAVAFGPDDETLLTASFDGTVRRWDHSGKLIDEVYKSDFPVTAMATSADGETLVWGSSDGSVWVLRNNTEKTQLQQHGTGETVVSALAVSEDGSLVASGSVDGKARLWNCETKQSLFEFSHDDSINAVAISPNKTILLTGSNDGSARLWSGTTGDPLGLSVKHDSPITTVSFSPDSETAIVGSLDDTASFVDATTGYLLAGQFQHDDPVTSVTYSPDGKHILTGCDDGAASLWSVETRLPRWRTKAETELPSLGQRPLAYDPNSKRLVVVDADNTVRFWNMSGERRGKPKLLTEETSRVALSTNGKFVVTIGYDSTVSLVNTETRTELVSMKLPAFDDEPKRTVTSAAVSGDGEQIAIGYADGVIRVLDPSEGGDRQITHRAERMRHADRVETLVFSGKDEFLASGSSDKTAKLWDPKNGRLLATLKHEDTVDAIAFSPDGEWLVSASNETARLWCTSSRKPVGRPMLSSSVISAVAFSPDGRLIATGTSGEAIVRLWDAHTQAPNGENLFQTASVSGLTFSPDVSVFCASLENGELLIWNVPAALPASAEATRNWIRNHMSKEQWTNAILFNEQAAQLIPNVFPSDKD